LGIGNWELGYISGLVNSIRELAILSKMETSTLFKKTLVGQIILFGVVALTNSIICAWNLHFHLEEEFENKGKAIAHGVANSTDNLITTSSTAEIKADLEEFKEISGVLYVLVVDANKKVIAHTFASQVPNSLLQLKQVSQNSQEMEIQNLQIPGVGEVIDISAPILAGKDGYVYVGMDKEIIMSHIHLAIAYQLLPMLFLFVLSAIAIYIMVKRVSQPLNQLTTYAQKLASKDFNATIDIRSQDEVGLLAKTMQSMAAEINGFVEQLETAVADATSELRNTLEALRTEQQKSETLLLNILPESIAKQLKEGESHIADGFAEVTILFADIVGFTQLSAQTSPEQLVALLNEIFTIFDQLSEKHGLEKIKTIGDAYMVASGLPKPRSDHAQAIAEMALDMQEEVEKFSAQGNTILSLRIGINTGEVVAGVIGTKKFIYDLWGDAVNTASRMESHGIAGRIQVSSTTYELLKDNYLLEKRGKIQVKGKGEMNTYLLLSRADQRNR